MLTIATFTMNPGKEHNPKPGDGGVPIWAQHTCECFCSVFTFSFQHLENIKNVKEQFATDANVNCSWSFLLTVLLAT